MPPFVTARLPSSGTDTLSGDNENSPNVTGRGAGRGDTRTTTIVIHRHGNERDESDRECGHGQRGRPGADGLAVLAGEERHRGIEQAHLLTR